MEDKDDIIYVSQNKTSLEQNFESGYPLVTSEPKEETLADLHTDDNLRSWKDGVLDLNILREDVYSVNLIFYDIEYVHFKELLNALKNKSDGGFYASIFNPEKGKREIKRMYRSDRTFKKKRYIGGWRFDLSVSIIEV